jgi:uncharacterized membrane protein
MDKMLVAVFRTEAAAYDGLSALKDLHKDGDITLYETAVIAKDSSGAVNVRQAPPEGLGTAVGALTGGLMGLLGGPVGAAIGVSAGGLTGLILDLGKAGVDIDFVDEVATKLGPGTVAVVAEVEETWETPVDARLGKLGGVTFRRLRSGVVEDYLARESAALEAELQQLEDELAHADAESRAAVRQKIDAAKKKLKAADAQAKARAEQAEAEQDAKIAAMRAQMKEAGNRQKAAIEKRIAAAKADHAARTAKLDQARKLIKEALA